MPDLGNAAKAALGEMIRAARKMELKGVAAVAVRPLPGGPLEFYSEIVDRLHREPDPTHSGPLDVGTNYGAVCHSKIWQSIRVGHDSGISIGPSPKGEFPYRGCLRLLVDEDALVYFSFSGGTQDEDVAVSAFGLAFMTGLYRK